MQIRIIVSDKLVAVDNRPVDLPNLDWSKFNGDRDNPWDDIEAVQFYGAQGHVEFKTVETKQPHRPNMRPPDRTITAAEFEAEFAWVIPLYEARKAEIEAEQAAAAEAFAKAQKEAEAADLKRRQEEADATNSRMMAGDGSGAPQAPAPIDAVTRDELEAKLAEQDKLIAALKADQDAKLAELAGDIAKAAGG